ncbi:Pre-mRNA-splicing factor dre4 [Podospora australis]|uniref:Pre-mRNA-splicing factor dre4 n=1 Tax=Podospora australis TaxID=1536484 RepID=A0AAN7AJB2_9PEZI|nr:Pre-mRNA-splicing factor dre4 [Podospora australis]
MVASQSAVTSPEKQTDPLNFVQQRNGVSSWAGAKLEIITVAPPPEASIITISQQITTMQPALKSTYKAPPLPPGWTEHKAPTGHTYFYNAETKESTYKRPVANAAPPTNLAAASYWQHQAVPQLNLSDPNVANAFMSQYAQSQQPQGGQRGGLGQGGGRGGSGFQPRPKPQPKDKPRSKVPIPGCEPWILVYTKYGRRFAYNPDKNASYWRIPEKLMPAIIELDKERIRRKAEGKTSPEPQQHQDNKAEGPQNIPKSASAEAQPEATHDYDSSEYEEVEVTDDEDENDEDENGSAPKRQRTEDPAESGGPVEFTEADIAAQLAAMGADYGEGDVEMDEPYDEGDEGLPLSESDCRLLFMDLLNDHQINPYSGWDKLIEEGKIFDDPRYTVLPNSKTRKEVWEEWSRAKIQELKERRAKEEKKDPRIPYIALLQEKATPKLYWPEFKRKYKKEDAMKDTKLPDKDREKMYREHISRLKLPQPTLKSDLKKLLESVPLKLLNKSTAVHQLPPQILADVRYISLDPKTRDEFVQGYISGLPPPPEDGEAAQQEEDEAARKSREERKKREKAMQDRERAVAEEKQRQEKKLAFERARLREEERELERAMHVDKKGLQSQLGRQE